MSELLYEKFDDEVKVYKFLNKISKDKLVRVVSICRLSGPEEGNFVLCYRFLEEEKQNDTHRTNVQKSI